MLDPWVIFQNYSGISYREGGAVKQALFRRTAERGSVATWRRSEYPPQSLFPEDGAMTTYLAREDRTSGKE
jgi:hypothetical protein